MYSKLKRQRVYENSEPPYLLPEIPYGTPSLNGITDFLPDILEKMYPITVDQTRQDNIPTQHTLQVHMHHLCCPCSNVIYPYYPPGYRPPILAQAPPIPRPSYLHHYQYTQLHVNPAYNVPLPPTMAQPLPQSMNHSPPPTVDLAFGPPPRDRRNLDNQEYEERTDKIKSETLLQYPTDHNTFGTIHESFMDLNAAQVASLSTEHYITYLVNGCMIGEKIAKRNEHRPCFKNIQNLCNRTRSEVVKPNITVSNIHSQGVPWATKDFIFAFVRAINCWCILRGYLGCKDGNLGKIDREISQEFRLCYSKWEKCTKQLTHYLIETFCKLDEANSPPNLTPNNVQTQTNPSTSTSATTIPLARASNEVLIPRKVLESVNQERNLPTKEMSVLKGIPGILHIPPASTAELGDARNPTSESTEISPREESDNESRVYMKPGSYNVPTKPLSSPSNTNSHRSIEFLETAQNVQNVQNQRKMIAEKSESLANELLRDKMWKTAQNVTPNFIKQNEESSSPAIGANANKICEVSPQQNKEIESWLNNEKNRFDCRAIDVEDDSLEPGETALPGKIVRSSVPNTSTVSNDLEVLSRTYRKRGDCGELRALPKGYSFRRNIANSWEYKNGGLTDCAIAHFDKILRELDCESFAVHIHTKSAYSHVRASEHEFKNPNDLSTIYRKLKSNKYVFLNEIVHDFRHIICVAREYFTDGTILSQLDAFKGKFEDLISRVFPSVDFEHITGEANEPIGAMVSKQHGRSRKTTEGDGDH